jgi:hypothetical protein
MLTGSILESTLPCMYDMKDVDAGPYLSVNEAPLVGGPKVRDTGRTIRNKQVHHTSFIRRFSWRLGCEGQGHT